jgi:predicted Zn finger-like uncharacterized protein
MDVRCERCQTEYEVEDASVSDLGTEVQCSDCGHLFMVKRALTPVSVAALPVSRESHAGASWKLMTTFGQSHELRDLTQLHKWIIERRVTRNDKVSEDGESWQTLGSMSELIPFFDIVDSAERARALEVLPVAPPLAPLQPPVLTPHEVQAPGDVPKPGQSTPQLGSPYVLGGPADDSLGALPQATDGGETEMIRAKASGSRGLLKVAVMVAVAGSIGLAGILWQRHYLRPAVISSSGSTGEQAVQAKVHATTVSGARPAEDPVAEAPVAEAPAVEAPAVNDSQGESPAVPTPEAAAATTPGLAAVPQSPAVQGYSALNRRDYVEAIVFFKEALRERPGNGTALFGLAEAYRGAGRTTHALQTYRRYVKGLPFGPDAGSARFHIRAIEAKRR